MAGPAPDLDDADTICIPHPRVALIVGYPFSGKWSVMVDAPDPRGFTRRDLHAQLVRVYSAMYQDATFGESPVRYNTHVESRFGTAYHRLEDLAVEWLGLQVRRDGTALLWIHIGS